MLASKFKKAPLFERYKRHCTDALRCHFFSRDWQMEPEMGIDQLFTTQPNRPDAWEEKEEDDDDKEEDRLQSPLPESSSQIVVLSAGKGC